MLILDATTVKLQALLEGAATTQPDYCVSYVDLTTSAFTPAQGNGTLNSSTAVDIVPAPGGSTQRQVKFISVFNRDNVSHTLTVRVDNNSGSTDRTIFRGLLAANEMAQYVDGEGWSTIDANGVRKFVSTASAAAQSMSYLEPLPLMTATAGPSLGSIFLQRVVVPANFNPDVGAIMLIISNGSSAGGTFTINMGIYSFNASTLSLASSTSRTLGYNSTAAASSYTNVSGTKRWSIPTGTWALTPGDYVVAIGVSIASSATSGSYSYYFGRSNISINGAEFGGGANNVTEPIMFGVYSAISNTLPASIAFTQVNQTGAGSNFAQMPWFALARSS